MLKSFKIYHEQVAEIEIDIPEGASLEEQRELVEETYYHGGKNIQSEDIPEITDIETEDGLSLTFENPFMDMMDIATDTLAQIQKEMENLIDVLKEKLSDKEIKQLLSKAHVSRSHINQMLEQDEEIDR